MGLELNHGTRHTQRKGLECKCKSVAIATQGGGLGPHRHDGTSPLPAYTTLAQAFCPNVSRKGRAYDQEWLLGTLSTDRPKKGRAEDQAWESVSPTQGATKKCGSVK